MTILDSPPRFIERPEVEDRATEVRGRAEWDGIPVDPFAIANRLGVKVLLGSFGDDAVEGVLRAYEGRPQILVRVASSLARQKFTVAHELGHFALHLGCTLDPKQDGEIFVDNDIQLYRRGDDSPSNAAANRREIQANMFAAALLMPAEDVRRLASAAPSLRGLAKRFGVSEEAMRYRMNDLNVW